MRMHAQLQMRACAQEDAPEKRRRKHEKKMRRQARREKKWAREREEAKVSQNSCQEVDSGS